MSAVSRLRTSLTFGVMYLAGAYLLSAAIALNPATSPSSGTVGGTVTVTGTGFPSGAIPNTSVSVTVTCPPGNGGSVTVNSSAVVPVGTQRIISFQIPPALTVNQAVTCQVTVSGSLPSAYNSGASSSSLTLNPPPVVSSVSPGAGTRGTVINGVQIVGKYTHFAAILPTQPTVTVAGGGVTVSNVVATDSTHLTATFTLDPAAVPGIRLVTAKTGAEVATLATGFLVSVSPAVSLSISPVTGVQGTTFDVNVTGTNTTFTPGTTVASFGDTVKVNSTTVLDPLHATVNVSVDPLASLGPRTVTVTTGGEYGIIANGFSVTPSSASLTSISPATLAQSASSTINFVGNGTHWVQSGSLVSFGGGIAVGTVTVSGNQALTANITVPGTTPSGTYAATVTTNGERVTLPNALTVTAATPFLSAVTPTAGSQGQSNLDVNITGTYTSFLANTPTANFGPNITVNGITVLDNTHLKANISIVNTAFAGGRTASLTSNGTIFNFNFTVNSSAAAITGINPASGLQGASVAIQVTGVNTHWVDGLTQASLDPIWITVNQVKVNSPTSAVVNITIATTAPVGARTVTLSTGGEIVSFNSFAVLPFTPTMSINPSSGMIGTTVPVVFNGSFTHWINNTTVANISGQGVSIQGFTVDTPWTAHASLVIDPTAPSSPAVSCTPGNRTLTLTTVSGAVDEIDIAPFCVTSTPAVLTSITPGHTAVPVNNLNVTITGQYTHFDNTTQVGFGPNITVSAPFAVTPTQLTVTISVAATAALGWRQAFVNTGAEQLSIGFNLDYPATSSLLGINPNTISQGQALTGVTITGNLTNWSQANTVAIIGLGITIGNLQILSSNTATADISASPTTPAGGRSVSMITGGGAEVESGLGFSVTPGIASVSTIGVNLDCSNLIACPASSNTLADINQGETKSFRVVGVATHFLDGGTILDFGPGISITQVHVVDATNLYGQITVSFQAGTGFRNFRAITDGEVAPSFSNSVNIHPVTGTINITPTTAPQGTTLDITVNGVGATHFHTGDTSATFGNNAGIVGLSGGSSTLGPADITVLSPSQAVLHVVVQGTAYCCTGGLRNLTITTQNVIGAPQNIEQINLPLAFFISAGAAIVTQVTPNQDLQGHSVNLQVTGQNTNFQTGVTTAYLTTGGCTPASPAGAVVTNVTATDRLHANLALAIDVNAATGVRGLCMYTLGESVGYLNAFNVLPGVPSLSGTSPVSGLQGQTLTGVALLGNFTHWTASGATPTNVTFGQGIAVSNLQILDNSHATVTLVIDPIAQTGSRTVVVTTGTEVVQGTLFTVNPGPAILSSISPTHANQGQHILMQVNGQFTHWAQGLTQFSIGGGDIVVNGFLIQSQTSAIADLTLSPTAYLGTRTVTMSTAGEVVSLSQGFLVTGGIPSLLSISPSTYKQCDANVNVQIAGAFTKWQTNLPAPTVFMGPNVTVNSVTVNSDTALTAVVTVACAAPIGVQSILVQQGAQGLPGQIQIISNAPPTPYISYMSPGVALKGQTLSVSLAGAYTNWLPAGTATPTQVTFGAGITVNTFQVTSLTSATANITIQPGASVGNRSVVLTTGAEIETSSFYVTVGTPAISLIDGPNGTSGIQGQTLLVNLVGAYTTWNNATVFNFGSGITITPGSIQLFGPTAARMEVTVATLAPVGGRSVTATTGAEVSYGYFGVSPGTATITSVAPNTVMQGSSGFVTHVTGFNTHWDNSTSFSFGGGDVGVTSVNVLDATHADVTMNLAPLAYPGLRNVVAQTGGEVATLVNGFVVTPGTPILTNCVNCSPGQGVFQQHAFLTSVLGQFTSFVAGWPAAGATTVDLGNGSHITSITVTGPQSVDISGTIDPLAYLGCRDVTVTTGAQVLKLYGAFCIGQGPAVISTLVPNTGLQGTTLNVAITGTNTNFVQNVTVGSFGPGISLNTLTVNTPLTATANITIAANATAQQNSVTLTTQGESATIPLGFTIQNNTPVVSFIFPTTVVQGTALDVSVTGTFTHWVLGNTTADFGTGIAATVTAATNTTATVHLVVSPIAPTGNHAVRMITNLGGGGQEIAVYTIGAGNGTPGYMSVTSSAASILSATPTSPAAVHQNDNGDSIAIVGSGTHFTQATPVIAFCSGVHAVAFVVADDTHISATVNVDTFAAVGACGVTVTTGGEVASGAGLFNVLAGLPVITSLSSTSARQNDTLNVTISGLYTHFTVASTADFGPGIVVNGAPASVSSTSATFNITLDPAAATTVRTVTVNSPGPEAAVKTNAFTVLAGLPQVTSVLPNSGAQGLTQNVHIVGLFTHFSASSVVAISGTGVTIGNPPASPDALNLNVNFTVSVGAPAGLRTVTVTTGGEVVSLPNAFNVLPGSPNLSGLSPNIGVPNSTVNVTLTGVFTHFTAGATKANFGPGISVNGGGFGNDGLLTVGDSTNATATLTIDPAAALGARNVVVTTPAPPLAAVESFTVNNGFTVQTTPSTPVISFLSPSMGLSGTVSASNVPINTSITVVFNEPMKASTITPANAFISDGTTQGSCWTASGVPASVNLDLSGRILTITPTSLLAVGRNFYLQLNSYYVPGGTPTIQDASGTQNLGHYCQAFTTGFAQDATGPTFLTGNIPAGATGVPTNVHPTVGFDKPVNAATISGLSFVSNPGAVPVAGTWSYSSDFLQYIFTPAANLTPATNYTLAFTNVLTDSVGHALTNPGTLSFTTGATTDTSGPSVTSITPIYNSTVATNPILRFTTNKPMNPLSVTQMYVYNQVSGAYTYGNVTHSSDFKTWDLHLSAPLDASTYYRLNSYSMYDWAGNCCVSFNQYFLTGTTTDVTGPTVLSVSPPTGSTGIAVNAPVWVHFSEPLDPTSVPSSAISLNGGAVAGTVAFGAGPDYTTLVFTPTANLAISTNYAVSVAGVSDTSGNPMAPFAGSSFQTSASVSVDSTHGTISAITPTGTNVPVNTNVVFQLNKPVNPLSVTSQSARVFDNTNGGHDIPGTISLSIDLKTLTFTPTANLPANHQICAYASYWASLYDLSGNTFNYNTQCFTTSSAVDLTPPTVISVTPPDASSGIGPYNPVVVTFSKPINPGTLANNVAMYIGSALFTSTYSLSADSTTISFNSGSMPYGTVFTVVVSPNITDLAANHLAAEFRSSFTTAPQPVVARPSVSSLRPGSGATGVPTSATVTFFTSAAMNPATVTASSVHISENGVLKTGSLVLSANNQAITFTPTTPFAAGSLIQIWFTSAAQDASGNSLYDYFASFTVAPDLSATPLTVSSRNPCYGCSVSANSTVDILFTKPVNPATVTSSSFFIAANFSPGSPVNGTISFLNNNRLIRFTPNAAYTQSQYYTVYLASSIQDTDGLSFAGSAVNYNSYFYVNSAADNTPPFVTGIAPTSGAGSIGTNAVISVTFSENVDSLTLDPANVTLTAPGNIPLSIAYNGSNYTMTVTPQAPLPAGAAVTLHLNGVSDFSGNPLNPTPYTMTFNTAAAPDYAPPSVVLTSLLSNQSNVPLNSGFSVTFSKPIDLRTSVLNNTVYLRDASAGYVNVPVTLSWNGSATTLTITPINPLSVGHLYNPLIVSLSDLNGNAANAYMVNQNFTTVLAAPAGGPQITQFVTPDGFVNVPENFKPQVQFDRPIQPGFLSGVTFVKTAGSVPVPMSPQLSGGGTILTVVPNSILQPNTQYTVTVAGVVDAAGNPISGPAVRHFTTGPSIDLVAPQVVSVTPVYNSTVGTNPLLKIVFNKPINPISASNFAMYQFAINRYVNQLSLAWSADLKSVTFNYPGPLNPNDRYYFYVNGYTDLGGNTNNTNPQYFYTSSSADNTPLTVTSVNPVNGTLAAPVNPAISVRLNKAAAPTSVSASAVTLSGVAGTTASLSADGMTISLSLPGLLAANTTYNVQVAGGAFTDTSGNAVTAFSSAFTTSGSGLSDTSHGGVSLTDPSPGSTGVALNKVITVTFSKPFNPNSILQDSFVVCINGDCNKRIAGTVAIVDANHLSFTPAVALPPGATISVFVYPFTAYMTDLAGNPFDNSYLYNAQFSTAAVVDNTPPTVTSMTPTNGATNVGAITAVALTFNKSLDSSTVNTSTFALYLGSYNLSAGVSTSADRRTVYLSTTLPFAATITVGATTGVKDYAGNSMANPYTASFATEAQPLSFNPTVIQVRPGNGAPLNSKVTVFTNSQINLTSAQNGLYVAQNGALIPGTVSLTADQYGIVWTPASNYQPGALIEVFVTSTVTDINLNPVNAYNFSFTTQATACTIPATTAYNPGRYNYSYIANPVIEVQFCEALDPATVTSASFNVRANSSSPGFGSLIAGTLSLLNNNTTIRFTPSADLTAGQYIAIQLTGAIKDLAANAYAGDGYYVYVSPASVHQNTPFAVSTVTPTNGATGIGDNAPVRIVFNNLIDGLTVTPSTVTLNGGAIPYTATFGTVNTNQTVMTLTPLVPLPDSSTINVHVTTGVTDLTGAATADFVSSFQTAAGADFTGPVIIQQSIDNSNNSNVPTNSTFTMSFSKPLDPSTVVGNPAGNNTSGFFYYDSTCPGGLCYPPSTVNISADLRTVTIVPSAPITPNSTHYYYWYGGTDLNGNAKANSYQYFTTGGGPDSTAPTVVQTNPVAGATGAPTNVVPELIFNEAVRATSLNNVTLNGVPVTAVLNNGVYSNDTVVKVVPAALLAPNTFYTVVATGIQDVAGNVMASPYSFSFTTGPNFNVNSPNFISATVSNNTPATVPLPQNTNIPNVLKTNPTFTFTWDQGIDYASLLFGAIWLTDTSNTHVNIPVTFTYSAIDQKTVIVHVNGTLTPSTQYRMWIHYSPYAVSLSGYYDYSQRQFPFTTEP